jgi:hypothetical protein
MMEKIYLDVKLSYHILWPGAEYPGLISYGKTTALFHPIQQVMKVQSKV